MVFISIVKINKKNKLTIKNMRTSDIITVYYRIKFLNEFITVKKITNSLGKSISDKDILKKLYNIYKKNNIETGLKMKTFDMFYIDFKHNKTKIKKLYEE